MIDKTRTGTSTTVWLGILLFACAFARADAAEEAKTWAAQIDLLAEDSGEAPVEVEATASTASLRTDSVGKSAKNVRPSQKSARRPLSRAKREMRKEKYLDALLSVNEALAAEPSNTQALLLLEQLHAVLKKEIGPGALPGETSDPAKSRRILFTYRDSRPTSVSVKGQFTNWKPTPMQKGENHEWSVSLTLAPGDYAYLYVVDGKEIRDPNNARRTGGGWSFIRVEPPQ